jgi:hypothetical protein
MSVKDLIDKHLHDLSADEMMQARFVNGLMYGINNALHKTLGDSAFAMNQRLVNELGIEIIKLALPEDEIKALEADGASHDHDAVEKLEKDALDIVVKELHLAHDIDVIASECDKSGNETREFEVHGCALGPQAKKLDGEGQLCAICPVGLMLAAITREAFGVRVRLTVREKKAGNACDLQVTLHP